MALSLEDRQKFINPSSGKGSGLTLEDRLKFSNPGAYAKNAEKPLYSGGFISDVFDTLSIPQYALTGALKPGISVAEAVKTRYTPSKAFNIKNPLGAFVTDVVLDPLNFLGFVGATSKGVKALKAGEEARTLAGAATKGEKALLTVGLPFTDKAIPLIKGEGVLKGLTQAGEAVKRIPGVNQTLTALGAAPSAGSFNTAKIEEVNSAFKKLQEAKTLAKGTERQFIGQAVREAQDLRDMYSKMLSAGKVTERELADVVESVVNPGKVTLNSKLAKVAAQFKSKVDTLQNLYRKLGGAELDGKVVKNVLTPELVEARQGAKAFKGAVREVGGNAGSEQFAKNVGLKSASGNVTPAFFKGKTVADLLGGGSVRQVVPGTYGSAKAFKTLQQAKSAAQLAGKSGAEIRQIVKDTLEGLKASNPESIFTRTALSPRAANEAFKAQGLATRFSEDPAQILFSQGKDVGKMRARVQFTEALKKLDIGKPRIKGAPIPAGYEVSKIKGLKGMVFPAELVPHLDKTFKSFSNIEDVNDFVKMYDKIQNTWKGFSTYFNPSFHTRNTVSNHWQLFLAGVDNPLAHVRGYASELAIRKALKAGKPVETFVKPQYKGFVREFVENQGLRSTGAFTLDTDKVASRLTDNILGDIAGAAGETLENSAKLSLYIDKRLKGFNPDAAGREVRKYLFDYSDLTDFEKNVLKRIFPFYTWTRKNLPLQVAVMIGKPTRITAIAKAKAAIEASTGGEPLEDKYMPEWLREAYPIYFGTGENGLQRFIKLEGFLPTIDLNKLGRPWEMPFENMSPLIKTPIELISNYDFYYEKEISEYAGQAKPMGVPFTDQSVPVNAYLQKILSNFRPLNELQKFSTDPTKDVQPTSTQALLNFLLGKTYQLDPGRQKDVFNYVQDQTITDIKGDLNQARRRDQPNEVQRLIELLLQARQGEGLKL